MHEKLQRSALLLAALGCAFAATADEPRGARDFPAVPPALAVPDSAIVLARYSASGVQIYHCAAAEQGAGFAWTLVAPEASLHDEAGAVAGRHYAGPTWEASDGSAITGKVLARAPAPDAADIAWLLLSATPLHEGAALGRVAFVQRLNTHGGVAPSAGCSGATRDAEVRVAYTADYWFYASR